MSAQFWFARRGLALIGTDEESRKVIERLGDAECQCFERVAARDPLMHRRYWALMTMIAKRVRQIEIDRVDGKPVYMQVRNKDHAHAAIKLCTGLYDVLPVEGTGYAIRVPHSTSFRDMTPDEWMLYWPRVLDVCVETIAPEIEIPEARDDMLRAVERWHQEAA